MNQTLTVILVILVVCETIFILAYRSQTRDLRLTNSQYKAILTVANLQGIAQLHYTNPNDSKQVTGWHLCGPSGSVWDGVAFTKTGKALVMEYIDDDSCRAFARKLGFGHCYIPGKDI